MTTNCYGTAPLFGSSTRSVRAVQAWQILVSCAMNRQIITYKELSEYMFEHEAAGVLSQILCRIAMYCEKHELPALTSIVVNSNTGVPGSQIPISRNLDAERARVHACNWYIIIPPSEKDYDYFNNQCN